MRLLRMALLFAALLQPLSPVYAQTSEPPQEPAISSYQLDPPLLQRAEALHRIRLARTVAYTIVTPLLLFLILRLRIAARFREFAESAIRSRLLQSCIVTGLLLLTITLLLLPLDMHGHNVALRYGLSVQSWGSWLWDLCKALVVNFVIASLLVWAFYALVRRYPRRWWLAAWLWSIPLVVVVVFVTPVVLDPIFNHYDPLAEEQPELTRSINKVVQRAGLSIPESRMLQMRASEKVTTYNAYVTGIGATKRIVVWDTTARDLTRGETLFIFGHEMGHYVLHHIWKGLAFAIAGLFVALWLLFRIFNGLLPRISAATRIRDSADLASLPLFLLIAFALSLLAQPIQSAFSRHLEHQADIYGLEVIHGIVPHSSFVAAASFQKLGEKALAIPTPNPFLVFWTYDHPPIADRVRFCLEYRPWDTGNPGRYFP